MASTMLATMGAARTIAVIRSVTLAGICGMRIMISLEGSSAGTG